MAVIQIGENDYLIVDRTGRAKGAQSVNNAYVAMALDKVEHIYDFRETYQLPGLPKGVEIDFEVLMVPKRTFVFVDGEYFHGDSTTKDRDKLERELLWAHTRSFANPIQVLLGSETDTPELAEQAVLGNEYLRPS